MHARFAFFGAVLLASVLVACGGGGGGSSTGPPVTPTPTPCASPAGGGVGFCGTTATAQIPSATGASYSATMNFSAGSGTATIAATVAAPSPVATISAARVRSSAATPGTTHVADTAPYSAIVYVTLTATTAVSLSSVPTITVSSPTGAAGAYYNVQSFWVTLPQSGAFTLAAGSSAYFAIYTGGALPSPNPDGCVGVQADASSRSGAHPALVGVQPIMTGAKFTYTGTLTQTISRASPCPIPTATQQASVTVAVTVTSSPSGSIDEHSVETDAYATNTTATTTDAIVEATSAPAPQSFAELSETSTDLVGDSTVTTYGLGALVYAVASPLPYTGTITNAPPSTVMATLADNTTTSRTYNANGSYAETDTIVGGGQNTITVNPNFSGSYNIDSGYGQLTFTYAAPSGGTVNISASSGTSTTTYSVPQWWTGTSLYSDSTVDKGSGALPLPCAPTGVTSADDFRRTIAIVDPVLGYTENETIDAYVVNSAPALGPACVVIADSQALYYDYLFDTPYLYYPSFTGGPLQTNTISEAYWYETAPTGDTSVRTQSSSPGGIPGLEASIAAHASGISFARTTQRAQRIENFVRGVIAGHAGGVK